MSLADAPESLTNLVASGCPPREARALQIGRSGPAARAQIEVSIGSRALDVQEDDDPFNAPLPAKIAICFVTVALARLPDAFEELLSGRLAAATVPDGIVALQFCRDASEGSLNGMKVVHPAARAALGDFLTAHFGKTTVSAKEIAGKFASGPFACLGVAARNRREADEDPIVWVVLKRRATDGAPAFPRTPRADRYPLDAFAAFLKDLRAADIALLPVDRFADEAAAPKRAIGHIKLDLHRNIVRPLEVAARMKTAEVPGLFLMMPRHPFNQAFFDAASTWETLAAIRDMGHEIGLHLDVFNVLKEYGDLYKGLEILLEDFTRRGFPLRAATLHGDTRKHLTERGLRRLDFFIEDRAVTRWDGKPPEGEEYLVEHIGRYSYGELAARFGIRYLSERVFRVDGQVLGGHPLQYASDNARALQVLGVPDARGKYDELTCPAPFRLPQSYTREAIARLKQSPFVALFHPQWFW
jgi:hypothetical protein